MKKKLFIFILFILSIFIIYKEYNSKEEIKEETEAKEEVKGVFISYIDYSTLKGKGEKEQKEIIDEMINNVYEYNLNTIVLQVRAFSDAIYYSSYFKPSLSVVNNEDDLLNFDILKCFVEKSHLKNMKIYVWINPYRIRNNSDIDSISKESIIYNMLNTNDIEISDNGIYFNPSSEKALDLIIKGVEEITKNYDIDGILYDDYFYPNDKIDNLDYDNYKESGGNLSINEYRIENINNLIKTTYESIKSIKEDVLFGISPSGNIENNLNNEYLDIEYILSKEGYIDFIAPQLYYGFNNSNKPYIKVLNDFNDLIKNNSKLYISLSIYKTGEIDNYAGSGKNEWLENSDIIKKQILIGRNKSNYEGFFIFRYNYLFSDIDNETLKEEVNNLKGILDN